jgi:hypothetical protein
MVNFHEFTRYNQMTKEPLAAFAQWHDSVSARMQQVAGKAQ